MAGELDGLADAYRAPVADYDDNQGRVAGGGEATDYVVSGTKLVLLFVATAGLYSVYWSYKHWRHQKLVSNPNIWPLPRAIFSVFFVAQLFKQLDLDARAVGYAPSWSPGGHAAAFIVLNVTARILDRLDRLSEELTLVSVLALLLPLLGVIPVLRAQQVVNLSVGDPEGRSNSRLGVGGVLLLTVGGAFWALVLLGVLMPTED